MSCTKPFFSFIIITVYPKRIDYMQKRAILAILTLAIMAGLAWAEEIEPQEDIIFRDADGALQTIFSIPAWESEITFAGFLEMQNGTAVIGGMKAAGS